MIGINVNSANQNRNATSFGTLSREAKKVINRASIRTILEREYGVTGHELRALDESPLKISLISELISDMPFTKGVCITTPKSSGLPKKVFLTGENHSDNIPALQRFALVIKQAFDMESVYANETKIFGRHQIKRDSSNVLSRIERGIDVNARNLQREFNSGEFDADEASASIRSYNDQMHRVNKFAKQKEIKSLQQRAISILPQWEQITGQKLRIAA